MRRAGVVVALVAGALVAVPASPAAAAPPEVQITSLSSATLTSGERAMLTFKVVNKNDKPPGSDPANIKVTSSFGELTCQDQCDFSEQVPREGEKEFTATLVAGTVPAGEKRSGKIQIRAEINGEESATERDVIVRGPEVQQPQTVKEISGRVADIRTGDAVAGATVAIADSGNHRYDTVTSSTGRFTFTGTAQRPISPGDIYIGAQKDGVNETKTISVGAGKSVTDVRLVLRLAAPPATASPPAEPSPSAEAALPSGEPTDSAAAATPQAATAEEDSGGGSGSLLLILLGGLLIALGVGAIVLLWLRRKDGDADGDAVAARRGGGPVRPAYSGVTNATQMVAPGAGAPTAVAGMGMADAPTMLQNRPVVDEFPDPYGAPMPPPQPPTYPGRSTWGGGYGEAAPTQGYGPTEGRPSSGVGYGAAPSSGGGYGSPAATGGGYGAGGWGRDGGYDERYDEPTGRFRGGDPAGYGRAGRGEPEPYEDAEPGYGQGPRRADSGGYADRDDYQGVNGYDDRGGYSDRGGYDQRGGYGDGPYDERGGYDQRGYDRVPEQREAGYDRHGYDRGGYADDPAGPRRRGGSPSAGRSERRSADWLDE